MNALVMMNHTGLTQLDDAILWLCVKHPPMKRTGIARILGRDPSVISQAMNRLRFKGYIDQGRGSCTPMPKALSYVSTLSADEMRNQLRLRTIPPPRAAVVDCEPPRSSTLPSLPMEPRGSMPLMIEALAAQQDAMLARANELLQRRVVELEREVADLKDQRAKALVRLGFVCDALSG